MKLEDIRSYIQRQIMNDMEATIEPDEDLLLSGRLDSLGVMNLIGHIEEQLGVEIPPEDVVLEHFGSLQMMMDYLGRYQK